MTNVIFAGNGPLAVNILKYLRSDTATIKALLLHPKNDRNYASKHTDELVSLVNDALVIRGDAFRDGPEYQQLADIQPEFLISAGYGYIFRKSDLLTLPEERAINVHTSMLPKNRGRHTGRWTIINGEPAGVTIHELSESIDRGDILAQREVEYDLTYTAGDLYDKMYDEAADLFASVWSSIKSGEIMETPQDESEATYNHASDLDEFKGALQSETFSLEEFVRGIQALGGEIMLETEEKAYTVELNVRTRSERE